MAQQHVRRWVTTFALIVCGTLLLAVATGPLAAAAPQANDQSSDVASDQHNHAQHGTTHRLYHIDSSTLAQEETPSVTVSDQPIIHNMITVDEVVVPQNGWAVVHTLDAQGSPIANQVIGSTQVRAGANMNVEIELTESFQPGDELQVMLHIDEGAMGTLEFPSGPDIPVAVDGQIVASNFTVQEAGSGGHQPSATPSPPPQAAQMPNTGTNNTTVPPLLIAAGLLMIAAAVLRHVAFRPSVH